MKGGFLERKEGRWNEGGGNEGAGMVRVRMRVEEGGYGGQEHLA